MCARAVRGQSAALGSCRAGSGRQHAQRGRLAIGSDKISTECRQRERSETERVGTKLDRGATRRRACDAATDTVHAGDAERRSAGAGAARAAVRCREGHAGQARSAARKPRAARRAARLGGVCGQCATAAMVKPNTVGNAMAAAVRAQNPPLCACLLRRRTGQLLARRYEIRWNALVGPRRPLRSLPASTAACQKPLVHAASRNAADASAAPPTLSGAPPRCSRRRAQHTPWADRKYHTRTPAAGLAGSARTVPIDDVHNRLDRRPSVADG